MTLSPGTRLGPYEITGLLGAGGMGEVYKARDTRLDRLVAVKVLRLDAADSGATRERFEQEARAISRLSHPNICALFDVGHSDGIEYLVMELLDGETLAARIAKGSLPLSQLLRYGREMTIALAAAHRQGIIHRDLKPGNVMLTSSGVKLLDFGLAKSAEPIAAGSDPGDARTTAPITAQGTWLGTAPYMAPEQIEGRPADARGDVFALGAVLYEMATGHRAFAGDSPARIGSAILQLDPPPVSSVRPELPPLFGRLVGECLAKNPEARWQSAHDVALQLAAIDEPARSTTDEPSALRIRTGWLGWAAAAALSVALIASLRSGQPPVPRERVELQILPPPNGAFTYSPETIRFALSPDGRELVFVASQAGGPRRAWRRSLASVEATPIAGTDGAVSVFWAPDGKSIAFFAGDTLKRLDLVSEAAVLISKVPSGVGLFGTWSTDGQILFASIEGEAIYRVSTSGGTPTVEVKPEPSRAESRVLYPSFLPDGRFLYLLRLRDGSGSLMMAQAGQPPRRIMPIDSNAQYVDPGALVFARDGTLVGQRFDLGTGQISGEPFAIASSVRFTLPSSTATFAAARSGAVVYQSQSDRARLAWLDRSGRELETVSTTGGYQDLRLTLTGRTVMFSRALPSAGTLDIWSVDLDRRTETRVTLDDVFSEFAAVMSPATQTMIFSEARGGPPRLMRRNLTTSQDERLISQGSRLQQPEDISPDGLTLAYPERTDRGHFNLWTVGLGSRATPATVLRESPFHEQDLRFSPDGRYYSFISLESGRQEVYVSAVAGGAKTAVSNGGARRARWSRDGRELFYLSADRRLIAVPIRTAPSLELGTPLTLFALGSRTWVDFDVSPDGKRFLAIVPEIVADEQPLTAILNWSPPVRP